MSKAVFHNVTGPAHRQLIISVLYVWKQTASVVQSFWLQIQRSRVRFPALPDFLSSSGSGTGSTQPRVVNWGASWIKSSGSGPKTEINGHGNPLRLPRDTWHTSPTGNGRSVGIVRLRTKATEFFLCMKTNDPQVCPAIWPFLQMSKAGRNTTETWLEVVKPDK